MRALIKRSKWLGAGVAWSLALGAQAAPPTMSWTMTGGWTSNAGGDAFEQATAFTRTEATIAATAGDADFGLRGSLGLTHTRYLDVPWENDGSLSGALEGELRLDDATALRGGLSLDFGREGAVMDFGGFGLATETDSLATGVDLAVVHSWQRTEIAAEFAYGNRTYGETRFVDIDLPGQRLEAHTHTLGSGLRAAYRLDGPMALSGEIAVSRVWMSAADQAGYGRAPATVGRVAGGFQLDTGAGTSLTATGGAEVLVSPALPGTLTLPYVRAEGRHVIAKSFALTAEVSAGASLDSPFDGVADWTTGIGVAAEWTPLPGTKIAATAAAERDFSVLLNLPVENRYRAELSVAQALSEMVEVDISLSFTRTGQPDAFIDEERIGVSVSAMI